MLLGIDIVNDLIEILNLRSDMPFKIETDIQKLANKGSGDKILSSDWNALVLAIVNSWGLTGNSKIIDSALSPEIKEKIDPDDKFLGTIGDEPLDIRVKNKTAMFIKPDGNVGIGTKEPNGKLHVVDTSGALRGGTPGIRIASSGGGNQARLMLDATAAGGQEWNVCAADAGSGRRFMILEPSGPPRFSIDVGGNVGIGTTSPDYQLQVGNGIWSNLGSNYKLAVSGDIVVGLPGVGDTRLSLVEGIGGNYFTITKTNRKTVIADNDGNITLEQGGNVGIGTTSPNAKFDVQGKSKFRGPSSGSTTINESMAAIMVGPGTLRSAPLGSYYPGIGFNHLLSSSSSNQWDDQMHAYIGTRLIDTPASEKSALVFATTSSVGAHHTQFPTEKMVITPNGNVGIGTTSPNAALSIMNDEAGKWGMGYRNYYNNEEIALNMGYNYGNGNQIGLQVSIEKSNAESVIFNLNSGGEGGYASSRFFVRADGNVGIGTTRPSFTLHTAGTSYASSRAGAGIDYAEYFESLVRVEIPAGTSVVLESDKIRPAKKNETPVGVISANPGVVGGVHTEWPKKSLRDEFGNKVMEEYQEEFMVPKKEKVKKQRQKVETKTIKEKVTHTEVVYKNKKYRQVEITETVSREIEEPLFEEVDLYDEKDKIIGKHQIQVMETYVGEIEVLDDDGQPVMVGTGKFETKERHKLNPDYDEKNEYVSREKRPEWNCVGLLGQIPLRKGQPVAPGWVKIKDLSDKVQLWLVK